MTSPGPAPGSQPTAAHDALTDDERQLFEFLSGYLDSVHSGDLGSRSALLSRRPELWKWMRCLELLDRLAAVPTRADDVVNERSLTASQPFGKYELFEEIGRGGMGVVYRARQTDLDRAVALKMILSSRLASADDVRRFYAEARAAGSLRHPNIVAIHEAGEVHGQHFFAMEFVAGRSLAQALADGPFEPRAAASCMASIGRAVHYLHEHGIVHRDLKPSNILLDEEGTPYVTDFGLAKALGADAPQTQTGAIVGTPSYMSPEQASGERADLSPRSDVYSLGAILFELLTGRPPFQQAHPVDTLLQVIEGEPPRPTRLKRDVPLPLEWICLKCLEKEPRNRYESAAALVDDLERFLRGEPLRVGPPGIVRSLTRWGRRQPALASHLGGIAVAALIVQGKYMMSGSDRPFHLKVIGIFGVWAAVAVLWDQLMRRVRSPDPIQYAWSASDVLLLTWILSIAEGPLGPLLVGYPLLIVTAGLFFRAQLVWFMTVVCLLSYGTLLFLGREPVVQPHYPIIYAGALGVIGFVVGYQAYRVRVLTGYFEPHRRT